MLALSKIVIIEQTHFSTNKKLNDYHEQLLKHIVYA